MGLMFMDEKKVELLKDGKRISGRAFDELREVKIKLGVLDEADGSSYIEWGNNKVIVGVYGPKEVIPRHMENPSKAILKCNYSMVTFCSKEEHGKMGPNRRSVELSKVIREALEGIVETNLFPRTQIEIYMVVLEADAGTRIASFLGAVAALLDAGIPIKDIAVGIAAGKVGGKVVVDLDKDEDNFGEADFPVALTRTGDILLLQMDGKLTKEEVEEALGLIFEKSEVLLSKLREAVEEKYSKEVVKELKFSNKIIK